MNRQEYQFQMNKSPLGGFGAIVALVLFLVIIYYLIKGAYFILGLIAPILLIATLIIDHKVVTGYLKFIYNLIKKNPIAGIGASLLTVLGAPFVAAFLFAKAMFKRSIKKYTGQEVPKDRQPVYTEYEEIEEEIEPIELPEIEEPIKVKKDKNDYEDLFD